MQYASDARLVCAAADGDEAAFAVLVRRYERAVWACARAVTGNDADAGDAAQETFIRFYRHIRQFNPARPLKPYLLKIAANCSRTVLTARRRTADARAADWENLPHPRGAASPERVMLHRERNAAVRDGIELLPPVLRQVCRLFYLAECSCREISEVLGMNENAVKVALHRARRKLAPTLTQWRMLP